MYLKQSFFPLQISITKNPEFFANLQWLQYKYFHKTRNLPCGQTKARMYCAQPWSTDRIYFNEDHTACYCKVCNHCKIFSNKPLSTENPFLFTDI